MNMIAHQMPLLDLAFLAMRQLTEYRSQPVPQLPVEHLLAILRNEDDVILAVPLCMIRTLVVRQTELPLVALCRLTRGSFCCRLLELLNFDGLPGIAGGTLDLAKA